MFDSAKSIDDSNCVTLSVSSMAKPPPRQVPLPLLMVPLFVVVSSVLVQPVTAQLVLLSGALLVVDNDLPHRGQKFQSLGRS